MPRHVGQKTTLHRRGVQGRPRDGIRGSLLTAKHVTDRRHSRLDKDLPGRPDRRGWTCLADNLRLRRPAHHRDRPVGSPTTSATFEHYRLRILRPMGHATTERRPAPDSRSCVGPDQPIMRGEVEGTAERHPAVEARGGRCVIGTSADNKTLRRSGSQNRAWSIAMRRRRLHDFRRCIVCKTKRDC